MQCSTDDMCILVKAQPSTGSTWQQSPTRPGIRPLHLLLLYSKETDSYSWFGTSAIVTTSSSCYTWDVNVPLTCFREWGNLLYSTRFSHTMSTIYLAGLQVYIFRSKAALSSLLSRVPAYPPPSHDLCQDPMLLSEASSELHALRHHVCNRWV